MMKIPTMHLNFDQLDYRFDSGHTRCFGCVVGADAESTAEMIGFEADGFIHLKSSASYAPISTGERTSDIVWYNDSGEVIQVDEAVSGTVYASAPYWMAVEAPVDSIPKTGIKLI